MAPGIHNQETVSQDGNCCASTGSAISGPLEAMNGPPEHLLYVLCLQKPENAKSKSGYLATVDANPSSLQYGQVIHRLYMKLKNDGADDELHHFGWNSCVSCKNSAIKRKYLVIPGLGSGNIYIVDVDENPAAPKIFKTISGAMISQLFAVTSPHTVHCIASGQVMISYMGDAEGNAKGSFLLLDGQTFDPIGLWNKDDLAIMGYDFWYQPRHNIMVSTEFGAPKCFMGGFNPADVKKGFYGTKLHFFDWTSHELLYSQDLGEDGAIPLEIRFLHNPAAADGFVGAALGSSIFNIHKNPDGRWEAVKVIQIPAKMVSNWALAHIPSLITDILVSLDDHFLYFANFLHGDVRQYDISNPREPKFISSVFIGGSICKDGPVKVLADSELKEQPERLVIKGVPIMGAPNMLQLSRDGKRMYVTMSLLTSWDQQFYPEMVKQGSGIILIDCSEEGMKINENFYVDLGNEPDGGIRGHELRYPGGDCSSDIWV